MEDVRKDLIHQTLNIKLFNVNHRLGIILLSTAGLTIPNALVAAGIQGKFVNQLELKRWLGDEKCLSFSNNMTVLTLDNVNYYFTVTNRQIDVSFEIRDIKIMSLILRLIGTKNFNVLKEKAYLNSCETTLGSILAALCYRFSGDEAGFRATLDNMEDLMRMK